MSLEPWQINPIIRGLMAQGRCKGVVAWLPAASGAGQTPSLACPTLQAEPDLADAAAARASLEDILKGHLGTGLDSLAKGLALGSRAGTWLMAPSLAALEALKAGTNLRDPALARQAASPASVTAPGPGAPALNTAIGQGVRDRICVVTGGAQGFGAELVRGLVDCGAMVVIADMNLAGAQALADQLNQGSRGPCALAVEVNVASEDSVAAMVASITTRLGGMDLFVSNAGVLKAGSVKEQSLTDFRFVTEVNYTGFFLCTAAVARLMASQNGCAPGNASDIVQINSKSGLEGSNRNGAYAGSKFGGLGLVQSFALELVEDRIKVNAICPGNFFDGPLWSDPDRGLFVQYLKTGKVPGATTLAQVKAFYEAKVPMKRGCLGADVLRALVYAVEQEYETGQAIPVTGGQVMLN